MRKPREGPTREQALYEEAKKRQERRLEQKRQAASKAKVAPKSHTRDPHVLQRFANDFATALTTIGATPKSVLTFEQISTSFFR